ncbi:MAG: ligase-associated DNA damage response DEXH box helicase [Pseudomonadota bacterium]
MSTPLRPDGADWPQPIVDWFAGRGWALRGHQTAMRSAFRSGNSALLVAPTGAGKTLAGFLPALEDLMAGTHDGLHTLYVSPLKALTNDIERNLGAPITEIGLPISVETRTGDTPQSKRKRQRERPPHMLLTTPESLMLMLSYPDADRIFGSLKLVILDEAHSFIGSKRGDFTSLALARLEQLVPGYCRFGLSATVADMPALAKWLSPPDKTATVVRAEDAVQPEIEILRSDAEMPFGGFMARYAVDDIYNIIRTTGTSIVFVNTRAQAELLFQMLWEANEDGLPIAIYHGSLAKEQRRKTEAMMADGKIRSVVATSALELGIDWGDVDLVLQVGAPKGVSRLMQRIGRSNHRLDTPSRAILVPGNRFEALECYAARDAIERGDQDSPAPGAGALDVVVQFVMNCLCAVPATPQEVLAVVRSAFPYRRLDEDTFERLFRFCIDGGSVLSQYDQYQRLVRDEDGRYRIPSRAIIARHRQNIGVIVEAARLKVKKVSPKNRSVGRILGEVEEYFAQGLTPGDSFIFAGEMLVFIGVSDMNLECRAGKGRLPKVPAYAGGQMPLSTFLSMGVRDRLNKPESWGGYVDDVREWLTLQQAYSVLPDDKHVLVEHFTRQGLNYTVIYTFEGRLANQTLGMLITRRMERLGLQPLSFRITDYGLAVSGAREVMADHVDELLAPDILGDELEEWIAASPMLKRSFRRIATITGLTEQRRAGERRAMKQITFNTDLIYDVLMRYEPDHILLRIAREDAEGELLDVARLSDWLNRFHGHALFRSLDRVSPLAIPILMDARTEPVPGSGVEALLEQATFDEEADELYRDIAREVGATIAN